MRGIRLVAVAVALAWTSGAVEAKQYTKKIHGREVVVHTNPIPSFCTEWFHLNMDGMSRNVKFKAAKFRKPAGA
jgi:hypothetical protein